MATQVRVRPGSLGVEAPFCSSLQLPAVLPAKYFCVSFYIDEGDMYLNMYLYMYVLACTRPLGWVRLSAPMRKKNADVWTASA